MGPAGGHVRCPVAGTPGAPAGEPTGPLGLPDLPTGPDPRPTPLAARGLALCLRAPAHRGQGCQQLFCRLAWGRADAVRRCGHRARSAPESLRPDHGAAFCGVRHPRICHGADPGRQARQLRLAGRPRPGPAREAGAALHLQHPEYAPRADRAGPTWRPGHHRAAGPAFPPGHCGLRSAHDSPASGAGLCGGLPGHRAGASGGAAARSGRDS